MAKTPPKKAASKIPPLEEKTRVKATPLEQAEYELSDIDESSRAVDTPVVAQIDSKSLWQTLGKLSKHFVILIFVTVLTIVMHNLLVKVFGNPKFFDLIPVAYVIDLGDIAIIFAFVIILIRELWNLE